MTFTPAFRRIETGHEPDFKIRTADSMPLMLIKMTGEAWWAINRGDKDNLVSRFEEGDLLLWAWVGQWSTTIFQLTIADLKQHYK
jgi:hypothetical protein